MSNSVQRSSALSRMLSAAGSVILTLTLAAGLMPAQALEKISGGVVIS